MPVVSTRTSARYQRPRASHAWWACRVPEMADATKSDRRWWDEPFRSLVNGQRVIVASPTVQLGLAAARDLEQFGAKVMVYALSDGPAPDDVLVFTVDEPPGDEPGAAAAHWLRHTENPSEAACLAFDQFDPDGAAIVFRLIATVEPTHLAGRRVVASRPPEWVDLEDKTKIDAFWDRHGVTRKPYAVVPLDDAPNVSATVDEGFGTVWVADARDGLNGGAEMTRWVRDADDAAAVEDSLRPVCDLVRVMPFIEGVPCSVHGIVTPDGVAVLRPVEMIVLRQGTRFRYLGASTYWDPDETIREQMRSTARRVGEALASDVDFRGAFTLDGVVDRAGFWPTELNPRVGGGLQALTNVQDAPPLLAFELLVAGVDIGLTAAELEAEMLPLADANRSARLQVIDRPTTHRTGAATWSGAEWSWSEDDQVTHADVTSIDAGVFAPIRVGAVELGASAAPLAEAFARFCDRELGTSVGDLIPAPDTL